MKQKVQLSSEKKKEMIEQIKLFYYKEKEEKIGDLAATIILDFFIEKLAPSFYNQGIQDAYYFIQDKLEDMFTIQV